MPKASRLSQAAAPAALLGHALEHELLGDTRAS